MKFKNIYIGLGLASVLTLSACKKVIEIEPEFQRERTQLFNNLTDYEYSLTGTYALLRQVGYFGSGAQTTSTWAMLPDMMADNLVQTGEDLANWQQQTNWQYVTTEEDITVAWLAAFSVIRQANITLNNIDQFAGKEQTRVNRIKGQALAIRAIAHFDVLRYWGESYDRNSTALGVPYVTTEDIDVKPSRLTVKASYDSIFRDMLAAEVMLGSIDKSINTSIDRTSIDRTAVRALLARMYLYAKEYARAEEYATLGITAIPLASRTAFPSIWKDDTQAEVFWAVSFNAGEGSPSSGVHNAPSNRNRFRPSNPLLALYDQNNDVRFSSYFGSRLSNSGNTTGLPRPILPFASSTRKIDIKFLGRGSFIDNVVNWKVIRTGELYLIRAEARAMQAGKEALGLADLNTLRAARVTGAVPLVLTGQALIDEIQVERRRELYGEGHRWFDLRRMNASITRTDRSLSSTRLSLPSTAREWIWPIPQGEIDANPNMEQNTVWK
jgi:hypothetical protein